METIATGWRPMPDPKSIDKDVDKIVADNEDFDGPIRHFWGHAQMENNTVLIRADDMVYNSDTHDVTGKGHVYFHGFLKGEQLWCDHFDYNSESQLGVFYDVRGESQPRAVVRRGVLSSTSPYHFEGAWADRLGAGYILHDGWVTNCKTPGPWWIMRGPKFDIIPGDRAKAYRSWFILRRVPIFYAPMFYHSLKKEPRHSGFLAPNFVPRSQRGFMIGLGYFWAINRSYDLTYRFFDYTSNSFGHHADFRGKPRPGTDFDLIAYAVQDRGGDPNLGYQKFSGANISFVGHSDLGDGWTANGYANYLSSFRFKQEWSQSYSEAIYSENHSEGFVYKNWSNYSLDAVVSRLENYQSGEIQEPGSTNYMRNAVLIHKAPEVEFAGRDKPLFKDVPVWFSFYSTAGLLYRSEPVFDQNNNLIDTFQTRQFTPRLEMAPHVTSALHVGAFSLIPSIGIDETYYGDSQVPSSLGTVAEPYNPATPLLQVSTTSIVRSARDFSLDLIFPSLSRIYNKKTIFGDKLKHTIEPRATYKYVTGVGEDYNRYIRFDEADLLANTSEVELSLTNRIYAKRGDNVQEIFTWELAQKRYFDPTFGGALQQGQPNTFAATADLTAYAFLVGPRGYSPVVSMLRASPVNGLSFVWQADYDPYYRHIVNSGFSMEYRYQKYYFRARNNSVHADPLLTPPANQYGFAAGFGDPQHRGWNAGIDGVYDYRQGYLAYTTTQVTYNTDCCGFSVQYRRVNIAGVRDDSRWYVAFSIANVGSFGSLKKQDRLF
jgi:LPS-assembly protein